MPNAKSAVVTGGGSGIGEAIALQLGEAGYAVTIGDIGDALPTLPRRLRPVVDRRSLSIRT